MKAYFHKIVLAALCLNLIACSDGGGGSSDNKNTETPIMKLNESRFNESKLG